MNTILLTVTNEEMTAFFARMGFETAPFTKGDWLPAYHNKSEWHEREVPGVVINGKVVEAEPLFSAYAGDALRSFMADFPESKKLINNTIEVSYGKK
jgi:hypothetical protein